jgi:uncharacterized membrane protein YczE
LAVIHAAETATAPAASRWRASPARLAQLLLGLCVFGTGEALLIAAELGNSPWTVLAEGVGVQTGVAVGTTTVAISFVILLAWLPLRQRPGLGTIINAIVVGVSIDVALALLGHPAGLVTRWLLVLAGIALVAVGSGLYLTTFLGPGPRDGLMTGLHRRTGAPIGAIRTGIEVTALLAGWALGGTLGLGTLAFAVAIGPAVAAVLAILARGTLHEL